jgi:hypothetical protein
MSSTYADFTREPSKPHQCMHESDKDGHRCRATAMHNEFMCFHHRSEDIPTVIQNEPFLVETLLTRDAILAALTTIAARLASNRIDLKRAALLIQTCQSAASNLTATERQANIEARTAAAAATAEARSATAAGAPYLAPEMWVPQPIPAEATAQTAPAASTPKTAVILNEECSDEPKDLQTLPHRPSRPHSSASRLATEPDEPYKDYDQYTTAEANHLSLTVLLGREPQTRPRPDTLTFQQVQNHLNARRKQHNMPPKQLIDPETEDQQHLIAPHSEPTAAPPLPTHRSPQSAQSTTPQDAAP